MSDPVVPDKPALAPEVDDLPPTQCLVLEVLAARWRLGEHVWTFPSGVGYHRAIDALATLGLVGWKHGVVQRTYLVWLTDVGRASVLSENYVAPVHEAATEVIALAVHRDWGYTTPTPTPNAYHIARLSVVALRSAGFLIVHHTKET